MRLDGVSFLFNLIGRILTCFFTLNCCDIGLFCDDDRSDCTQIPKLRIACGSGPSGQRSMWSMCEECGAVQMMEV